MGRSKLRAAEIQEIFSRFRNAEPSPQGELHSVNGFTFLVAVVLSAQATDAGVNRATKRLFAIADTPEKMIALGLDGLMAQIKTIGLFRAKARNVLALSEVLVSQYSSNVPRERDQLEALPGVGRKTANVVMNQLFGEPTIAVDTHLFRVGNRTGLSPGKTPLAVETVLNRVVPDEFKQHAHHWLILHGRYICKAQKPRCPDCVIADICKFKQKVRKLS